MENQAERIAAIYDIHGNLPALEAVLGEIDRDDVDLIVVGGDVAAGPMPGAVIERLRLLGDRARFVRGNADRMMVAAFDDAAIPGAPPAVDWAAAQLSSADRDLLASFQENVVVDAAGIGSIRFCHGSPRSDEEILTSRTSDARLAPILSGVEEPILVCGHTHIQFDRTFDRSRVLNAGSVGMPYEVPTGARWLRIGPGIEHRITAYDIDRAAAIMRTSGYPDVGQWIDSYIRNPTPASEASVFFEDMALKREEQNR
ncbi:MAG: metallophosphoesterase family protein [Thermomicrobiales bacterium]